LTLPHPRTGARVACQAFDEPDFARVAAFALRGSGVKANAVKDPAAKREAGRGTARRPTSPPTPKET
jgi:hypothetical protein